MTFKDYTPKSEEEIAEDIELIGAFLRQEVVQPEPDSGLPMIRFPRVHIPMPTIKVYDPNHPHNLLPYEARKFTLGSNEHSFLVPKTPTIDTQPITTNANSEQIIEELTYLYRQISTADDMPGIDLISTEYPNAAFVEVDGIWPDVHSMGSILLQGGGRIGSGIEHLLYRKLEEIGQDFNGAVFYGLVGEAVERFSIVSARQSV